VYRTALSALILTACLGSAAQAQEMMDAAAVEEFIIGKAYQGINPETEVAVASVVYHADGTSTLWMAAEGSADEPGSWRIEGNSYCTRYLNFRENSENCFTLSDIGEGRAQAYFTDGRIALILSPIEMPERFQ
jgi:hypothetical protein